MLKTLVTKSVAHALVTSWINIILAFVCSPASMRCTQRGIQTKPNQTYRVLPSSISTLKLDRHRVHISEFSQYNLPDCVVCLDVTIGRESSALEVLHRSIQFGLIFKMLVISGRRRGQETRFDLFICSRTGCDLACMNMNPILGLPSI